MISVQCLAWIRMYAGVIALYCLPVVLGEADLPSWCESILRNIWWDVLSL